MRYLLPLLLLMNGCGLRSCGGPSRAIPKIPIDVKKYSFPSITVKEIVFDWVFWCTWIGSACVIIGILMLLWSSSKDIAVRLVVTGFALNLTAKAMLWFEHNQWVIWLGLGASFVVYCILNPMWCEKILKKFGIEWDINNDGHIGPKSMWFKSPLKTKLEKLQKADTEVIDLEKM